MDFDEELIETVRKYPPLYSVQNHKYKDIMLKDELWREIGVQLKRSPLECKAKWRNIRDSYRRYQNKKKAGTAISSKYEDKKLSFIGGDESNNEEDTNYLPNKKYQEKRRKVVRVKRRKTEIRENDPIQITLGPLKDKPLLTRVDTTPVHSFFNSMADIVCNFPADKIAQIRQKVCNVVTETELLILSELEEAGSEASRKGRAIASSSSTTAIYLSPNAESSSSTSDTPITYKKEQLDSDD